MSPEQLQAPKSVDHRTDVWALGTVLYELVSGQAPFIAGAVALVYAKILATEAPPLREFLPDAPPELEAVLARCLQKRPEDRYATVAELAVALAPFAPKSALPCVTAAVRTLRGSSLDRGDLPILPNESVPPPPLLAATVVAQAGSDAVTVADVGPTVPAVSPSPRALRTIEIDNTLPATATSGVVPPPKRRSFAPLVVGAGLVVALGLGGALFWNHAVGPSVALSDPEIVAASTSSASPLAVTPEVPSAAPRSEAPRLEVVPVPAELPATIPSASPEPAASAALGPALTGRDAPARPKALKPKTDRGSAQFLEHRK
jgi:serine/threonine-protein kinase